MMPIRHLSLFTLLLFSVSPVVTARDASDFERPDYLQECCAQQVQQEGTYLELLYREVERKPYHSPVPWMSWVIARSGAVVVGDGMILRYDTVFSSDRLYASIGQYDGEVLLHRNYRGQEREGATPSELERQPLLHARYSPIPLLEVVRDRGLRADLITRPGFSLYTIDIDAETITFEIDCSDTLLRRIVRRWYDEMLGEQYETILYDNFEEIGGILYPTSIVTDRGHGFRDTIEIVAGNMPGEFTPPLDPPPSYAVRPDEPVESEVLVEKLSENIHAITFLHAESRSLLVEFDDFFVAIDVPFNSNNGERVLEEAARVAPLKPVRYFAFGHHHPWYVGGIRPFVHRGATVLIREENSAYVHSLIAASHATRPDSLHLDPRPLHTKMVDTLLHVSDGSYEMQVIPIGKLSAHTDDYLLFYFPREKMLLHGDLAWIRNEKNNAPASDREKGLYQAILDFDLEVDTILQTWPASGDYGVRTIYPFEVLKKKVVGGE